MDEQEKIYLDQIPKPRPSRLNAKSISSILDRLIMEKGYAAEQERGLLQTAWTQAVGEQLSNQSRVGQIKRGILQIYALNDIVRSELEFQKVNVLRAMKQSLPELRLSGVRILVMKNG